MEISVNSCNMKIRESSGIHDRSPRRLKLLEFAWRPWVWLLLVALVAWRCGGGGGSSCSQGADIQGLWTGPVTSDQVSRGNPGTITANIFQSGCSFVPFDITNTGTWKFEFQDPSLNQLFAVVNGSTTQSQVNLAVALCTGADNGCGTVSTCVYNVTATLVTPIEMSGSYVANSNCASFNQGTFDIALQHRFTPTAVPTSATPVPTSTPGPTETPSS
jgi:hypothetical protein